MFGLGYEDILNRIVSEKGMKREEVEIKINKKLEALSDLISKEGAAHIIANELGVKLIDSNTKVKLNKLRLGMDFVNVDCKVLQIYDVRSFNKNGREGKVVNILVGDETGKSRVVFWDVNQIKMIEEGKINANDILSIKKAYVKVNNNLSEIHLGNKSEIEVNPANISVDVVEKSEMGEYIRKSVDELKPGEMNVGVMATIVQVFEPKFFDACPTCRKKVVDSVCGVHGSVKSESVPIANAYIDDGSETIRVVGFRNIAEQLMGVSSDFLLEIKNNPVKFEEIRDKALGNQFTFIGRVVNNEYFGRNELLVSRILEAKPEKLIEELSA